ncbi:DUF1127 domain-containing protein [Roseobacteraceae bacterium S113]
MTNVYTAPAAIAPAQRPGFLAIIKRLIQVSRQRKHLARLDASHLEDVGLTRAQVLEECNRPAWDAPAIWKN